MLARTENLLHRIEEFRAAQKKRVSAIQAEIDIIETELVYCEILRHKDRTQTSLEQRPTWETEDDEEEDEIDMDMRSYGEL